MVMLLRSAHQLSNSALGQHVEPGKLTLTQRVKKKPFTGW